MHLIVHIPETMDTETFLRQGFAQCVQNAGFMNWQLAAGTQEISVTLQRHLNWNRVEKMSHDSGVGWIRVYPCSVATYTDVLTEVETFVATQKCPEPQDPEVRPLMTTHTYEEFSFLTLGKSTDVWCGG